MVMSLETGQSIDGFDAVSQLIEMIVWTRAGSRPNRADYGTQLYDWIVTGDLDRAQLASEVRRQINDEPDLNCSSVNVRQNGTDLVITANVNGHEVQVGVSV